MDEGKTSIELDRGCLPFDKKLKPGWSTGVVNGKRQNPNGNFHTGFAVPFTVPSDPIRKAWDWSERANGTFSLSIYIPTEISGFFL